MDAAMQRAKASLSLIATGVEPVFEPPDGPSLADELHAMCRVITEGGKPSEDAFRSLTVLYRLVSQLSWPEDEFEEKSGLLAKISYLAWIHTRRAGMYSELSNWEKLTAQHAMEQESVLAFLSVRAEARSEQLNRRFLSDSSVLLAAIAQLRTTLDRAPLRCVEEASSIYQWLSDGLGSSASQEELAYLSAEVALLIATGGRLCGTYRDSEGWLGRLDLMLTEVNGIEDLRAKAEYVRLTILHHTRGYETVVEHLPALEETFGRLGMGLYVAKCRLLKAVSLKEIGRESEARLLLDGLTHDRKLQDPQILALSLVGLAELDGRLGMFDVAMTRLAEATAALDGGCLPVAVAHLHGIRAEVFRDQGLLELAADSYQHAVSVYVAAGMNALAAYVRIVLAETLLAAGREDLATTEILAAWPVIAKGRCVEEALVATMLLRESVRRREVDRSSLQRLREQLDRMRRDGEL